MFRLTKEFIADAYRRRCQTEGRVLGERAFMRKTGLPVWHWRHYWPSWAEFQADMGFAPNSRKERIPKELLLRRCAELALELDKLPTKKDMDRCRERDPSFPDYGTHLRLGRAPQRLQMLEAFCRSKSEFARVLELISEERARHMGRERDTEGFEGIVYLARAGDCHQIIHECATGKRLRRIAALVSYAPGTLHVIDTDDPIGVEQYWRKRFRSRRAGRKGYHLTFADIRAFQRRKYQ